MNPSIAAIIPTRDGRSYPLPAVPLLGHVPVKVKDSPYSDPREDYIRMLCRQARKGSTFWTSPDKIRMKPCRNSVQILTILHKSLVQAERAGLASMIRRGLGVHIPLSAQQISPKPLFFKMVFGPKSIKVGVLGG